MIRRKLPTALSKTWRAEMAVDVKICGLTDRRGLDAAIRHGARMVGFNFFPASPRFVSMDAVAALAAEVPQEIERVGVTVDMDNETLEAAIRSARLSTVQLHGHEDPARAAEIRERFGIKVLKVVRVSDASDLEAVAAFEPVADLLMFDTKPPKDATRPGGNAIAFDWRLLAGFATKRPWLLSGGLEADNVRQAVEISGASAVDVASGVESVPGSKDPEKIREFMAVCSGL